MNKEFAWMLGYLLSDGSIIRPTYRYKGDETHLNFICKYDDRKVLYKLKAILKTKAKVRHYPNYKSPQSKIEIWDRKDIIEIYNDIKTVVPANKIKGYERHFIRGLFDGDGTLSYRQSRKTFRIGYINEHKHIAQWVANFLEKELCLDHKEARFVKQNNVYEILWEGNVAKLIANYLYHGNIDNCCLTRKQKKYQQYCLRNKISNNDDINKIICANAYFEENNEIAFINISGNTLKWCKRLKSLLSFNTVPVFHNKGKRKYYHLYIPDKILATNMRDLFNKTVKA